MSLSFRPLWRSKLCALDLIDESPEIAVLWLNNAPVNALNSAFMRDLHAALTLAESTPAIRALIIASGLSQRYVLVFFPPTPY